MCRVLNEDGWKIMDDGDFLFCLQISFSVSPTPTFHPIWISEYSYVLYLDIHTHTYKYLSTGLLRLLIYLKLYFINII